MLQNITDLYNIGRKRYKILKIYFTQVENVANP